MGCFVLIDTREPSVPVFLFSSATEERLVASIGFFEKLDLCLVTPFGRRLLLCVVCIDGTDIGLGFFVITAFRVSLDNAVKCVEGLGFIALFVGSFV